MTSKKQDNVDTTTTQQNTRKRRLEDNESEETDYTNITEMDLELKEFKCPRCNLIFSTTNDLFVHMRETYKDPTVCQLCGKNLNCMANVLSHSYLHQGIKPYKCPKCHYATRTRFNLRVHFGSCAKIEKFSYKRGNASKKRKTDNKSTFKKRKNRKRKKNNNDFTVVCDDKTCANEVGNINTIHMYSDDVLNQLVDSGPISSNHRDISCLVQVHIQHFPRSTINATDQFYQKPQLQTQQHVQNCNSQVDVNATTDISGFYPPIIQSQHNQSEL